VLGILAAVAALAVLAAPVASAGHSKAIIYNGHAGLGANSNHTADEGRGINASGGWDPTLRTLQGRGAHVIASLGVKYTA
jgi:hypothetical protein